MGMPWEEYQQQSQPASTNSKFDPSTARLVTVPDGYILDNDANQIDYLGMAESIAVLWLPILLLGWYYKTKQLQPSGWRRSGAVLSVFILLIGSIESVSQAAHGSFFTSIFVTILAATPWVIGYAAKWIIDGFRTGQRRE